jgi:uncharacterized Zn-binding protein involved in type VI secretion
MEFPVGKAVIRKGVDMSKGHPPFPPTMAIQASSNVFANGIAVVRQGDMFKLHCSTSCHQGTATGSSTVMVNGKGIATKGKPITCGDFAANGSPNVSAGG